MKPNSLYKNSIAFLLSLAILFSSCYSSTIIKSIPSGAKVYVNDQIMGTTPYTYRDTKLAGSLIRVRLEADGYKTLNTSISRDERVSVGAIIGGIFLIFPFLWTMSYDPVHTYQLEPIVMVSNDNQSIAATEKMTDDQNTEIPKITQSKAEILKLMNLLDQKIISKSEYNILLNKIKDKKYNYNLEIPKKLTEYKTLYELKFITKQNFNQYKWELINTK